MKKYTQIRYEERVQIAELYYQGQSLRSISRCLNRSPSTLSRELKRNALSSGRYWPDTAQSLALKRCDRLCLLDRDLNLRNFVLEKLQYHYWTPEQMAGFLKHRQNELPSLSHESIYAWLYKDSQRKEKLWKFLPRHKARRGIRKSKGIGVCRIPHRISIHERSKEISEKREFGHWEGDLMSFRRNSGHILVLRERMTMYTLSTPLPNKQAVSTAQNLIQLMKNLPQQARKTVTLDNGGEFAAHEIWLKEIDLPSFFCDAYASWQKGGVENTNGRLRRDLPRKINIHKIQKDDFDETIDNYNDTPRKSLNWFSPKQAFNQNLLRVALRA